MVLVKLVELGRLHRVEVLFAVHFLESPDIDGGLLALGINRNIL